MSQPPPQRLLVLPTIAISATAGRTDDQRSYPLTAGESLEFGSVIEQGIHGYAEKINHVEFNHRM